MPRSSESPLSADRAAEIEGAACQVAAGLEAPEGDWNDGPRRQEWDEILDWCEPD